MVPATSLGSLTESTLTTSVEAHARAKLSANEAGTASFFTIPLVSASVTIALTGDVTDAAFQASVISAVQGGPVCASGGVICTVNVNGAEMARGFARARMPGSRSFRRVWRMRRPT